MGDFDFVRVYEPGIRARTPHYGLATIWCRTVGELVLTSGKIVARDPGYFEDVVPFNKEVPPGSYPVILALAHFERTADERVASAMLQLSKEEPVRWEWARRLNQKAKAQEEEQPFCYCVDSGTGCFMDKEVADLLLEWKEDDEDNLYAFLNKESRYSGGAREWPLDPSTGLNVITFTSGWGDGGYPSCWGYDADDNLACLATDFGVLSDATFLEEGEEGYHAPTQYHHHHYRPTAPHHYRRRAARAGKSHRRSRQSSGID